MDRESFFHTHPGHLVLILRSHRSRSSRSHRRDPWRSSRAWFLASGKKIRGWGTAVSQCGRTVAKIFGSASPNIFGTCPYKLKLNRRMGITSGSGAHLDRQEERNASAASSATTRPALPEGLPGVKPGAGHTAWFGRPFSPKNSAREFPERSGAGLWEIPSGASLHKGQCHHLWDPKSAVPKSWFRTWV